MEIHFGAPRMKLERTLENSLRATAFLWPLWVVGVSVGGYSFTGATLFLVVLGVLVILRGRFWTQTLRVGGAFLIWVLLSVFLRFSVDSYILSWLGLGAVLLPFFGTYPSGIRARPILDALYWGCLVSFGFAAYELALSFVSLPPLKQIFPFGLWVKGRTHEFLGLTRVKATMAEPAHYARYLVLAYAILDTATLYGYQIRRKFLFRLVWIAALLSTLSLSGIILGFVYLGTAFLVRWRHGLQRLLTTRLWISVFLLPFIFFVSLHAAGIAPSDLYNLFTRRLEQVFEVIQFGIIVGSEGGRVQSTLILFRYFAEQDLIHFLTGEGWAHHDGWLVEKYGYLPEDLTSFARGDLHNAYSVVGISTGFVGLSLFLRFVWNILSSRLRPVPIPIAATWLVARLGSGYIIWATVWIPLLLSSLVFRDLFYENSSD